MRGIFVGDSEYKNQSDAEITRDFEDMTERAALFVGAAYSFRDDQNLPIGLKTIILDVSLFAERIDELFGKHAREIRQGRPSSFLVQSLKDLGIQAHNFHCRLGRVWHETYYDKYSTVSRESELYAVYRDFCGDMVDLNNIGFELERRYFEGGKPLYALDSMWWEKPMVQMVMLLGAIAGIVGLVLIFF